MSSSDSTDPRLREDDGKAGEGLDEGDYSSYVCYNPPTGFNQTIRCVAMVKFTDFSKFKDKLDVSSMVKNVKSMVNPDHAALGSAAANAPTAGDPLSQKMAEITTAVQSIATANAQQADAVKNINQAITALNKEIAALKKTSVPVTSQAASMATPAPTPSPTVSSIPTSSMATPAPTPAADAQETPAASTTQAATPEPSATDKTDASQDKTDENKQA